MKCSQCSSPLIIANSLYESEESSTDVYNVLTLVCTNPKCGLYAGKDLNSPLKIAEIKKNKVN